jgi:hypothetical protein
VALTPFSLKIVLLRVGLRLLLLVLRLLLVHLLQQRQHLLAHCY